MDKCTRCGNEIDPDVCWCGDHRTYHGAGSGHSFVPMGCDCGRCEIESPVRSSELLSCPFCGRPPEILYGQFYESPYERYSVRCRCMMYCQTNWVTKESAVQIWNARQDNK